MRKILSLLIAVVLGVSTAFATTVYCKMTHSWWNADGAAVAVHYWGGATETTWPGVRMEAVTGEEGTWSYDVPADVEGLIFVRVNGTGAISDWGAKTADLTLPTDGKNLFTITNETPSWGDPGCNGVWSVYGEEPAPQVDTVYTWYGKRSESASATEAIEAGGTAAAYGGNANIVVGTAQKTNWTIKLNKGFSNANYVGITLEKALAAGDKLQVAAFRTTTSDATFGIDFSADAASAATTCQVLFPNNLQTITTNVAPKDTTFTIPECAAGAKFIRIYRNSGSTGIYVANFTILREGGATPEPPVGPTLADGFYLIGQNGWNVAALSADLLFAANPEAEGEYVLNTTLAAGQEIKAVKVENDAIVTWYPDGMGNAYTVDAAHAGENKDIYFRETYKEEWAAFGGHIWTGANEEPQPTKYCEFATGHLKDANFGDANGRILLTIQKIADSNNIRVAIKNNAAAGNTKAGLNYLWVNAEGATNNNATYGSHEAEDVEEVSVIVEFDEAKESYNFANIHWAYAGWDGEWAIDGLTVSAAELCEASAPVVELNYYMKNNWDAASDWTWKAMTKDGENYKLEKVVFGGTGVNYNTAEADEGSSWVPVADIAGDAIAAKDTVTLVLDPAAGTVTATLIGKYNDPNPGEHTYTVAGNLADAFGTAWDPENTANDMEMNDDGIYVWEKTELTLAAGSIGFKVCEDHAWTVAYPANDYQLAIPEAGIYTIWIHFDPANGNAVTAGATKTGDATVTIDYYLVGSAKGWEAKAENIFTLNAEAGEGIEEYVIETTLEVGEGLKVLSSTGTWYPDGMGNAYTVDQNHAGATTIYFRPAGNAEWAAFGGFMYVVPTGTTGIDAIDANAPAVKVLRNGHILIKKGDKTYNVMGAIVR